jgi:hypothetical protein
VKKYEPDRPQMTIKYGACALSAGKIKLQTYIQNMKYVFLIACIKLVYKFTRSIIKIVFPYI